MIHQHQFPRFMQAKNHLPLSLVVCQSISVNRKFTELLHDWSISINGIKTYNCLLEITRDALESDELMLCLFALAALHKIMRGIKSDDQKSPEPVRLIDVHYLLTGEMAISDNQVILRDMVWAFFCAATDTCSSYFSFLNYALTVVSTSEHNLEGILDQYWKKRLLTPLSHVDAMAEFVQSVSVPVRTLIKSRFYTLLLWWLRV